MLMYEWEVEYEDYLWEFENEGREGTPMTFEEYVKSWEE